VGVGLGVGDILSLITSHWPLTTQARTSQPVMGSYSTGHGSYSGRSSHGGHGDCCCCGGDDGLLGGSAALAAAAGAALGLLIAAAIKAKAVRRRRREIGFPAMASSVDLSRELFFTGRWDLIILFL